MKFLGFPVPVACPGLYAKEILPSLLSSRISHVELYLQEPIVEEAIHPKDWEEMDRELCRLAELFKAAHGEEMDVKVFISDLRLNPILELLESRWPMPNLEKEAKIEIGKYKDQESLEDRLRNVSRALRNL